MKISDIIKSDKFIELAISRKVESNTGIFGYNYMQYKKNSEEVYYGRFI